MSEPNHDLLCRQAAAMLAAGSTQDAVRQQLGLSRYNAAKLCNDPETKRILTSMGEEVTKAALVRIRQDIARMTDLAMKALESNLKKNSMEAVKTLLRVAGALDQENTAAQDTTLTVIMPGAKVEKVIEAESNDTTPTTETT